MKPSLPRSKIDDKLNVQMSLISYSSFNGPNSVSERARKGLKHRKNCECCHHHSLFKGHNVNVNIVVLNCQK